MCEGVDAECKVKAADAVVKALLAADATLFEEKLRSQ